MRNPFEPETPLGILRLRNRGLGTSGAAFQQFVVDGRVYGHIIDPRSGEPALGPASVTVLAPTAALADALSTAFYLLGPEAAAAYVAAHPEVGVVIVDEGPSPAVAPRVVFGLSEHDFVPAEQHGKLMWWVRSPSPKPGGCSSVMSRYYPGFLAAFFIVLLRIAIGWHFLYEGCEKVEVDLDAARSRSRPRSTCGTRTVRSARISGG